MECSRRMTWRGHVTEVSADDLVVTVIYSLVYFKLQAHMLNQFKVCFFFVIEEHLDIFLGYCGPLDLLAYMSHSHDHSVSLWV